ncbi:hypothetical protein ACGFZH_36865 [Streptomyces zaomyceticus]|uniref:hypothetical protein n=1 Tax=Streptomyces zaomyceticus TaxID=68286 RepID=UPI0037201B17
MDAGAVAAALEDAHFNARQDSRNEDLADDKRARAELAEWERLDQLLTADAAAAADHEAAVRQVLCKLGALEQTEARDGDETVRDKLTRRAGGHVQADVAARRAHALAAHLGHYRNPAPPQAAVGLLPTAALAHAALLTDLDRLPEKLDNGQRLPVDLTSSCTTGIAAVQRFASSQNSSF